MDADMILQAEIALESLATKCTLHIPFTEMNHKMTLQCCLVYESLLTIRAGIVSFLRVFPVVSLQLKWSFECDVA